MAIKTEWSKPDMVSHTCNATTHEAGTRGSPVRGHPSLGQPETISWVHALTTTKPEWCVTLPCIVVYVEVVP
jgi:hypothetical protein